MESKRNIFLEAAMSGHPVLPDPSVMTSTVGNSAPSSSTKRNKETGDIELRLVSQAIKNVGRLPAKVLRYVELMAYNLQEVDKTYYSNVRKQGGPSKAAALKRIARRMKAV